MLAAAAVRVGQALRELEPPELVALTRLGLQIPLARANYPLALMVFYRFLGLVVAGLVLVPLAQGPMAAAAPGNMRPARRRAVQVGVAYVAAAGVQHMMGLPPAPAALVPVAEAAAGRQASTPRPAPSPAEPAAAALSSLNIKEQP